MSEKTTPQLAANKRVSLVEYAASHSRAVLNSNSALPAAQHEGMLITTNIDASLLFAYCPNFHAPIKGTMVQYKSSILDVSGS